MLLVEQVVVLVGPDRHTVREIGISVVLFKFGVLDAQVNIAVDRGRPAQDRVVVEGRVLESLADGEIGGSRVDVLPVVLVGDRRAVIGIGAVKIGPSVAALFAEVLYAVRVIVGAAFVDRNGVLGSVHIADGDVEAAAVKGIVALGVDDKIQTFIIYDIQVFDRDLCQRLFLGADRHVLEFQELTPLIDHQLDAVRITGVLVAVYTLYICHRDIDSAVFRHAPLQDRRNSIGCMQESLLDLQAADADLEIFLSVKGFEPPGPLRALGIAVAVEPAVRALFAEILHVKSVVRAVGRIHKGRFIAGLNIKCLRPQGWQELNPILSGRGIRTRTGNAAAAGDSKGAGCKNDRENDRGQAG